MNHNNRISKGHMGNTIKFSSESDKKLFFEDFNSKSILIEKFNTWKSSYIIERNIHKHIQ